MSTPTEATHSHLRVLIIEHEAIVDPGLLGERLDLAGAKTTVVGPHLPNSVPTNLEGFDALIVLGGSMGPLEDEKAPWLPGVRSLISEALEAELPLLGVCLGAQLLATVAGSTVAPIEAGPEIGLATIELTTEGKADPLLGGLVAGGPIRAVQWHYLEAKNLPLGSTPLMSNAACTNQAFRIGPRAWGLQFHLEALEYTAKAWSVAEAKDLDELGIDAETEIISVVRNAEPELRTQWSAVIDRWIALAAEHAHARV